MMSVLKNTYTLLEYCKKRSTIFENKISNLYYFLMGYEWISSLNESILPFWYFHDWISDYYSWGESTAGWRHIILEECKGDEVEAFDVFFQLLEEFKKVNILSVHTAELQDDHKNFHQSVDCQIKSLDNAPVWQNPKFVSILEFSHNFGWSFIVDPIENLGLEWRDRFNTETEIKSKLQEYFGNDLKWTPVTSDMNEIGKKIFLRKN